MQNLPIVLEMAVTQQKQLIGHDEDLFDKTRYYGFGETRIILS